MVRMKTASPAGPRKIPHEEKVLVDFLSKEMHSRSGIPSSAELANPAVEAGTFMSLDEKSGFLMAVLEGRRLIDLGAGFTQGMERFSEAYGVSEYVAVDLYHAYGPGMHGVRQYVNEDILRYLATQPDSSANVCMMAINEEMLIHWNPIVQDSYEELLLRNIARVVHPGGIAFGMQSPILHELGRFGFEMMRKTDIRSVTSFGALYLKPESGDGPLVGGSE